MVYPNNFEEKIGFDKIRQMLKDLCMSDLGRDRVDTMAFSTDIEWIEHELKCVAEFKQICLFENQFPTANYFDMRKSLNQIRVEGMFMDVHELFDFKRSLDTFRAILRFFHVQEERKYPTLRVMAKSVTVYPYVYERADIIINKHGVIKDSASSTLQQIRRDLMVKQSSVSKITQQILKRAQSEGWVDSDSQLAVRDGKFLIPISSAHKRKIKGFVFDESATGRTSYIEPIETIELNNDIRELEFDERREITKILIEFANDIRPYIDDLLASYELMALIDFIRSKAMFAVKTESEKPHLKASASLDLRTARHPLLFLALKNENKKVIPLDLNLDENERIILISGPNAGGKSVCLKTVGTLQYMVQSGLLTPASEYSHFGIFEHIFIDIGDEQSIENDLSTYSSHLKNMKFFIDNANTKTLVLIDEFGTGTEPLLGGAIAEAALEEMNSKKVRGIITTHYTNLKHFAAAAEGIVNGAMLYDTSELMPLFKLEVGLPGSSFAFEIAGKIGLSQKLLDSAARKVGQDHMDFDKNLKELEAGKRETEKQNRKLQQMEIDLQKMIDRYNKETEFTLSQRKSILAITKEQAKDILARTNKQIENTIHEIRISQADKEKTKEVRKELEEFKTQLAERQKTEEDRINEKIERLKKKELEKELRRKQGKPILEEALPDEEEEEEAIVVGDFVKIEKQNIIGEVIEIKGKKASVAFGTIRSEVALNRLEKVSKTEAKKAQKPASTKPITNFEFTKTKSDFMFGLDVRGKRTDEAIQRVTQYIDEALIVEADEVKILHGKGNGILKQMIREYVRTLPFVKDIRDESVEYGGAGISIITFEY